jgi:putative ABC transport system permease protein
MSALKRLFLRLIHAFEPGLAEPDLTRQIESHLALLEEDYWRRGMTRDEARLAARRAFNGIELTKDRHRDARSFVWLDDARRDLQYAARTLRREPGFTLVVVLTLALGIGANTAIFSVVHAVLLRPLPYADSDRLVRVWDNVPGAEIGNGKGPDRRYRGMDVRDLLDVSARARTLTHLASYGLVQATATLDGDVTRLDGYSVSAALFPMLGARAFMGRTFGDEDATAGHDHVVVLRYDTWQRFGANANVLGHAIRFSGDPASAFGGVITLGVPYTIIGVMPAGFEFQEAQFWIPLVLTRPAEGRVVRRLTTARLAPGVPPEIAAAEMAAIRRDARGAAAGPAPARPRFELIRMYDELTSPVKPALIVLTAAVGIVLLIACVNVANLLLARTAARQREIAVRAAIGAGRGRLVRQMLTESVLLAGLGGLGGVALSYWGVRVFRGLGATLGRVDIGNMSAFPRLAEISVDATVLGYALALSIVTGLVFGIVPALRYSRLQQGDFLRQGAASPRSGLKDALVIAEMALATVLLVGGGLLVNSFIKLATVDPGFNPAHVLTFQVGMSGIHRAEEQRPFAEALVERLRTVPGVQSAAYARQLPMVQLQDSLTLTIRRNGVDQTHDPAAAPDVRFVSRDYLKTMGIPILAGRGFADGDGEGRPGVVVINEALAHRDFAGVNPIGDFVVVGPAGHRVPFEIVGVAGDVKQFGLDRAAGSQYFMDIRQVPTDPAYRMPPLFPVGAYYTVRASGDPEAVLTGVRAVARQLDPNATVDRIATMEQIVSNSIVRPRMYAVLVAIFSGVAVALAAIGLYGVMAYSVARRTREIGIRMALGARGAEVMRLVLRQSTLLIAIGLICGLGGAAAVTRYLEGLLFGLTPLDPSTFIAVPVIFAIVAALAAYVPARRATRVDPITALRTE